MPRNIAKKTVAPTDVQPVAVADQDAPPDADTAAVAVAERPKPQPPKKKAAIQKASTLLADEVTRERRLAESREELLFRLFRRICG